jgi:hypothetical protein
MKQNTFRRLVLAATFSSLMFTSAMLAAAPVQQPLKFMGADTPVFNVTNGDYDFDLFNKTNGWVLNGFYTYEGGKWSKNWLSGKVKPGDSRHMVWSSVSDKGECVVPFKVTWDDYDQAENYKLDWCKGVKSVYLKDTTFTVDYK